jgi:DNA-binding protein
MEAEELDIVGISNAVYLSCASVNMATNIANVHINEICLDYIDIPILGKIDAISFKVSKKADLDFPKLVSEEEKEMVLTTDREGQLISVGHGINMDKLITLSLIKFAKFQKLKFIAAGASINEAVSLVLKLTKGQISKEAIGIDLINVYSISTRYDPTKQITAISIYLKKGLPTQYSKRHTALIAKLKG